MGKFKSLEIEYDKDSNPIYPFYNEGSTNIEIFRNNKPSEYYELARILFDPQGAKTIDQADLHVRDDKRKGYGSAAFRALVKYSINKGYERMVGMITENDNPDGRLKKFYEKNFCKVIGCTGPNGSGDGKYILDLTNPELLLKEFELQSLRERVEYLQPLKEELKIKRQEIAAAKLRLNEVDNSKVVKILRKIGGVDF